MIFRNWDGHPATSCERCRTTLEHHLHGPMAEYSILFCPACDPECQWCPHERPAPDDPYWDQFRGTPEMD